MHRENGTFWPGQGGWLKMHAFDINPVNDLDGKDRKVAWGCFHLQTSKSTNFWVVCHS